MARFVLRSGELGWGSGLVASLAMHSGLAVILVAGATLLQQSSGARWGSIDQTGDAISATLVSGIPLPAPQQPTENVLANDSKGLSQSVPDVAPPPPQAIPIPERETPHRPQPTVRTSPIPAKPLPNQPPPPPNVVP